MSVQLSLIVEILLFWLGAKHFDINHRNPSVLQVKNDSAVVVNSEYKNQNWTNSSWNIYNQIRNYFSLSKEIAKISCQLSSTTEYVKLL